MITNPSAFAQLLPMARRKRALALYLALCTLGLSLCASAQRPKFTTFDVPDSIKTLPLGINRAGMITGQYTDTSFVTHAFLRVADGTFTTIDAPGSVFTIASSIN